MADRKPAAEAVAVPDAEQLLTVLARVVARMVVRSSVSQGAATFRQIAVMELKVATDAEATAIEAWLTSHPGG